MKGRKVKKTFNLALKASIAGSLLFNPFYLKVEKFKPLEETSYHLAATKVVREVKEIKKDRSIPYISPYTDREISGIYTVLNEKKGIKVDNGSIKLSLKLNTAGAQTQQYNYISYTSFFAKDSVLKAFREYYKYYLPTLKDTIKTSQQLKNLFLEKIEKKEIWKGRYGFGITLSFGGLRIGVGVSRTTGDVDIWLGDPNYTLVEVNYLKDFARSIGMDPMDVGMYIRAHGGPHYLRYAIERLFNKNNDVNIREAIFYTTKDEKGALAAMVAEIKHDDGTVSYSIMSGALTEGMIEKEKTPHVAWLQINKIKERIERISYFIPIGYDIHDTSEESLRPDVGFYLKAYTNTGRKIQGIMVLRKREEPVASGYADTMGGLIGIPIDSIENRLYVSSH